jgi:hypothetical protein
MTAAERQAKYRKRLRKSINRRARTTYKLVKEAPNREATRLKREVWNAALPADEEHFDYRVGDCREKLADIPDNSVALILTDPPYEDSAEPLWQWLGSFAKRVLVPGGAIVCYFGGVRLNKLYRIFDDAGLDHWAPGVMLHGPRQRLWGIGVLMNHKNIVCYTTAAELRRAAHDGAVRSELETRQVPARMGPGRRRRLAVDFPSDRARRGGP